VVFNDRTLAALAERRPRSRGELLAIEGIGPAKLDRYGDELLSVLAVD
jgi:superfamily II DNA helicase RecQ